MWYMKSVRVTTQVPYSPEDVFDFLDVMSNHEPFTNHILKDWEYSGPDRGIGSKARVHVTTGGRTDTIDIEVVSAHRPTTIVERNIGAGGKRVANGTYRLEALANGGTAVEFEYAWRKAPLSERLTAPVIRSLLRRANETAMRRLREQLAAVKGDDGPALSAG
jgi:ribosome-associated toxin RatA of RatAB toxin-antitoxin module